MDILNRILTIYIYKIANKKSKNNKYQQNTNKIFKNYINYQYNKIFNNFKII